jgi:hypothetical protein
LREAHGLLAKERSGQRDVYSPLSRVQLEIGTPLAASHLRYRARVEDEGQVRSMTLSPTALGQLARMAGVPGSFLERVPPALGLKLLRCLLDVYAGSEDKTCLLRLKEEKDTPVIRAVLPPSFVRISDRELLEDLEHAIDRSLTITHLGISNDVFAIRVVFDDEVVEVGTRRRRDPAMAGLDLRSSETGVCPLQVRRLLYRQVCENGMTSLAESQKMLRKRMSRFDRGEFRRVLREAAQESVSHGQEMASRLRASRSDMVKNPQLEVQRIFRNYKLGSPRSDRARWVVNEVLQSATLFGFGRFELVQAFTAVARGLEHDRRLQWEDAMTDYLLSGANRTEIPAA